MKATSVFVVVLLVSAIVPLSARPAGADPSPPPTVRLLDSAAAEAYARGDQASPTFRDLVRELAGRRVVVHVVSGRPRIFGAVGATRLVCAAGARLYLRIDLDTRGRLESRAAVLAHELRHVLEIADAAASTQDEMRRLYERIGRHAGGALYAYETAAAEADGVQVLREIRAFAAAQTLRAARTELRH